jgi:hypothetical protein
MTKARDIASASLAPAGVTSTELGYIDGVTSAIQTQLNQKPEFVAGKNKIINGDFSIWQRGTSLSGSNTYLADRWNNNFGAASSFSQSRQAFTPGSAPVAGYEGKFFWRGTVTTAGSETAWYLNHFIEDVQTLAGQTATLSFWAKADSARSVGVYFNQVFGSGGSTSVNTQIGSNFTLTTSWVRYTATINVPSISGKTIGTNSYVQLFWAATIASGFTVDLWGVQLEVGSIATAFQTATGTVQGELAACQRYYETGTGYQHGRNGSGVGDNHPWIGMTNTHFQVQKRATPTITLGSVTNTGCYTNSGSTLLITGSGFYQSILYLTGGGVSNMTISQQWTASAELA